MKCIDFKSWTVPCTAAIILTVKLHEEVYKDMVAYFCQTIG